MKKQGPVYKFLYRTNLLWVNFAVTVLVVAFSAFGFIKTKNYSVLILSLVLVLLVLALNVSLLFLRKKKAKKEAERLGFSDGNGPVCQGLLDAMQLPTYIITEECRLCWANDEFKALCEEAGQKPGTVAGGVYKKHVEGHVDGDNQRFRDTVKVGKRTYRIYATAVSASPEICGDRNLATCVYFVDISGIDRLITLYKDRRIVLGEIIIDNYDEIFQTNGEAVCNQVIVEVNNIFEQWLKDKNAIIKTLTRERYILIVETRSLEIMKSERFHVLEQVKKINVGNSIPVTLSIGISTNSANLTAEAFDDLVNGDLETERYGKAFTDTLPAHFARVDELLSLSLSRGGDQAIVKMGDGRNDNLFYGGSEIDSSREDLVPVRVNGDILKKEILAADKVLIMGHAQADLDALGAAIAVHKICKGLDRQSFIVLESPNSQIDVMYNALTASGDYDAVFLKKNEALNVLDEKTLVVVVDTFTEKQTEAPEVVRSAGRIIVIDHHRRGVDYIKNTVTNYTETKASSTSELMVEIMRYLFPNEDIVTRLEAETLYGGILVDTKNLYFKTGPRTFSVTSYLRTLGVNPVEVRKYVQPNFEDYMKINSIISGMKYSVIRVSKGSRGVAITTCTLGRNEANTVAPIAADKMLEIAGVDCSFVIIKLDDDVSIKARSLGDVNVQIILENPEIGGGGHLTAAGGYMKDCTPERAEKLILSILKNERN